MIKCTQCFIEKPKESFPPDKYKKNGLKSYCRDCAKKYDKIRYNNDPEGERARTRDYRKKLKETSPEVLYARNKNSQLKRTYNITLAEYNKMLEEQNGVCFICKTKQTSKQLAVDHCHATNKVRKLLCSKCNTALGLVNDDVNILTNMIKYLTQNEKD